MASNTENLADQNPAKTLEDPTLPPAAKPHADSSSQDAPTDASSNGAGSTEMVPNVGSVAESDAPLSDIQKKMRRAERFGISVQLSEQEKRNSRAERFGTRSTIQASAASEERKRNARAERFGIPCSSTTADNEQKKKARLASFPPASKPDPLEEEKRKARALRFSNPPSSSLSQASGRGNIEPKAAIAGNAGEAA